MNRPPSLIVIVCACLLASCTPAPSGLELQDALVQSFPHDASLPIDAMSADATHELTAEGADWSVSVTWDPAELNRSVTWREGNDGFSLVIPLRSRPKPFTLSSGGGTLTRYGPHQGAAVHKLDGVKWHVLMSHEQADFSTIDNLTKELEKTNTAAHYANSALSPDGILVSLCGPSYTRASSLNIQIWLLTVNGKPPAPEILKPFHRGSVTIKVNGVPSND